MKVLKKILAGIAATFCTFFELIYKGIEGAIKIAPDSWKEYFDHFSK